MSLLYYFILIPLLATMGYYLLYDVRKFVIIGIIYLSFFINSLPWEIIPVNGVAISSLFVFIFLSIILLLINKKVAFRLNIYLSLIVLFSLILVLNIGLVEPSNYGVQKAFLFLIKCVIPIITIYYLSPFNDKEKVMIVITIIIGGVITSVKLLSFGDLSSERVVFSDTSPITIGREIGIGLTISIILYLTIGKYKDLSEKRFVKLFLLLIMMVSLTSLTFTGSRGPILSVVFGVTAGMILARLSTKGKVRNGLIVLSICILVIILNNLNLNIETTAVSRIFNQFGSFGDNTSDQARFEKFGFALEGYKTSPLFGVGTGNYYMISPLIREGDYPHNLFLETMAEQGLIGLLIMVLILIVISIKIYSLYGRKNPYLPILAGLIIYSFINSMVSRDIPANSAFWISSILLWAFDANEKDVEKK